MCFVIELSFTIVLLATKLSFVYSSIHFEKVEVSDLNKTLDESTTSNEFVCTDLGEECQVSAQCCGVATCTLPSWSENPVCLVPGYKHEEKFRRRFFSLHNLRPADIRYIRDSYNTSQYDFLLADLTFSAPPLDNVDSNSSSEVAANITVYNGTADAVGYLRASDLDSSYLEHVAVGNQTINGTLVESYNASLEESYEKTSSLFFENENSERDLNNSSASDLHLGLGDSSVLIDDNSSRINSTNSSVVDSLYFKNHFKFLLLNNTLKQADSKLDLEDIYDKITNTNRFKIIVEKLREKLREINEIEKNLSNCNTENKTTSTPKHISSKTDKPTSESTDKIPKPSKWNVVKQFFIHSKESPNDSNNLISEKNTDVKEIMDEIASKKTLKDNSQENENGKIVLQSDYPDNVGFRQLMEDVDKIEEIIDSERTINTFLGSNHLNNEGLVAFYNVDSPLASFDGITNKPGVNNSLERVFKDLGDTINFMIHENKGKSRKSNTEMKRDNQEKIVQRFSFLNKSVIVEDKKTSNKPHFWDKIHFLRVPHNLSTKVEKNFKQFFFLKKESSTTDNLKTIIPLNENFLLNLNSVNDQKTVKPFQEEQIMSESPSYLSEFSNTEELYNNSYIFMVHKEHFEEPVKHSNWEKFVNLFHREKIFPLTLDANIHDFPSRISGESDNRPVSNMESKSIPDLVDVPKIIKLPEYLMPEALEERQENETRWLFEDSEDAEDDRIADEHKLSNGSFFFFFQ